MNLDQLDPTLPELAPGLYPDVPEEAYHQDQRALSQTGAKLILEAPAKYRWAMDHPPESKPEFDLGSAVHKLVLGPGPELVVHRPDPKYVSPKSTKAWKEEQAQVRAAGGILLLPEEMQQCQAMAAAVREHPLAAELLSDGEPEMTSYAQDPVTGVWMRGRFDWFGKSIVDLKTTWDATPQEFGSKAARLGYAIQSSWYRLLAELNGHPPMGFAFVLVEKDPPYLPAVVVLDEEALDWGAARGAKAREVYRDCTDSGVWPGYQPDGGFTVVSLPAWAFRDDD